MVYLLVYKRDVLGYYSEKDTEVFLSFVNKYNRFIFKPLEEHSGHGIRIISKNEINVDSFVGEMFKKGPFIVKKLIEQGKEIAVMHPQSVNSLRVVTFVLDKEVSILGVTWRIGVGNSVMDNAGSGVIYVSVDFEHGFFRQMP